ncbi:AI-2E family transporter [Amycolatopsis rubida]|uniref:AI-2E family transporter n=1 Tax=Amycolatopsis rubida TaxID=112413 RepID=A0A1I5ZHF6_9PSEU|nr:AI-2E family transporter [Amycolatopsis rubida]MYW93011.1 AI-2E family transporter [Amycolatopsis rubida]NEC57998.1 AI-2E family transporter [Amycolatopsis rubida]SFQ55902.1 Predicted PurR-regulated permease PerM [Amycolatopsis rubida]
MNSDRPPARHGPTTEDVLAAVPYGLRVAAAVSGRLLVVAGGMALIGFVVVQLATVLVPVAVALLLTGLLAPSVSWLARKKVPRALATAMVIVGGIAVVGGVVTFVVLTVTAGMPALIEQISHSVADLREWLRTGPVHLSQGQLDQMLDQVATTLDNNRSSIASSAVTTAVTVGELATEFLLMVFCLIFFLAQGRRIWTFVLRVAPARFRPRVDLAGQAGFTTLARYIRGTAAVAVVDAVAIGAGLLIVGVPLAAPLAALVFLGAFIPVVGSVVAGVVAVLVALLTGGVLPGIVVLAIVIGVMQLESHVLQPFLLGRAIRLHPLAVVLALAAGLVTAGIVGALLAVPLLAVLSSGLRSLNAPPPHAGSEPA